MKISSQIYVTERWDQNTTRFEDIYYIDYNEGCPCYGKIIIIFIIRKDSFQEFQIWT